MEKDGVRAFFLDDFSDKFFGNGEEVDFVSQPFGGLNRSNIGVDEDAFDTYDTVHHKFRLGWGKNKIVQLGEQSFMEGI